MYCDVKEDFFMTGKMLKKAVAGLVALLLVSGGMQMQPFLQVLDKVSVTANAANGSVTLDEKTGVLTLSGDIALEDVRKYAGSKIWVESVVALEGTVLPRSCAEMFRSFVYAKSIDLSKADTSNVTDMSSLR
jgi:surface protein